MKKILVVVDMQKDFIDGALGTPEAVAIVPHVVKKIKTYQEAGDAIYFTLDTHNEDYLNTQEGKNLPVPHCIKGTKGWALHPDIAALARVLQGHTATPITFEKGIFGGEELAHKLRDEIQGLENVEIELVGLCTDICVLSNAILFKTYMPEACIKVDGAGCAGVTPQSHTNALDAMKMCQIQINS
ncbi:MAG: isochorismatase family cysteine hydrolase [Niameybacter sp.]|uniref:cysteine hydrolase family protein n=1 Tax=Niameybacter sp. TaxID=2033640 RepID=UPI002FCA3F7D